MIRRRNIIATEAAHVIISAHCPAAYRVASFDNKHSPKTQRRLADVLHAKGVSYESRPVMNSLNQMVYRLCCYTTREERLAAIDSLIKREEGPC